MTPHDELMALAGRIEDLATEWGDVDEAQKRDAIAADLRALLDSDAFRAMARNDARYRWLRANAVNGSIGLPDGWLSCDEPESEWDAAIDAAAIGAITPTPPTSEGEK